MPEYNVHLYPVVRVLRKGITADSPKEAFEKAFEKTNFRALFDRYKGTDDREDDLSIEYSEALDAHGAAVIDVVGDKDYQASTLVGLDGDILDANIVCSAMKEE